VYISDQFLYFQRKNFIFVVFIESFVYLFNIRSCVLPLRCLNNLMVLVVPGVLVETLIMSLLRLPISAQL